MAKHRDHRELGQLLDLFSFHEVAPGAPFWHANGMVIFRELEKLVRRINDANGYQEISTPLLVKSEVFKKSGHWDYYREHMFYFKNPTDAQEELVLKPMNCPESTYVYNSRVRSYRDLPLRLAEFGRLHRNEFSGTLGGLFRVRQLTMDDAHIYCRPDQVQEEITAILTLIDDFYKGLGFAPRYLLSTRPEKALGEKRAWDAAEKDLTAALKEKKLSFEIKEKEGAFYGPKIDCQINDSQNRDWQLATIQLDMMMLPEKFDIGYIDEKGKKEKPFVIHRAILGSFERFIGVLLEHTDGNLPVWLSPVQVAILPLTDKQNDYGETIKKELENQGIRVTVNKENTTLNKKIREAELERIPYMAVVGQKEIKNQTVSVRRRESKILEELSVKDFAQKVLSAVPD